MRTLRKIQLLIGCLLLGVAVLCTTSLASDPVCGSATAPDVVTHYILDKAGQVIRQYVQAGTTGSVLSDRRTDYDLLGRAYRTRDLADPASGAIDDAKDRVSETLWDAAGNVLFERRKYDQALDGYDYTHYQYDNLNRRLAMNVDANVQMVNDDGWGDTPTLVPACTTYGYDGRGNVTSTVDPASNLTCFLFDAAGKRFFELRYERYQGQDTPVLQVDSAYDSRGNKVGQTEWDVATTTTALTQQRWYYDALGRLEGKAQMADPASQDVPWTSTDRVTIFTYDADTERPLTMMTFAGTDGDDQRTTTYQYDSLGRSWKITDPNGNVQELTYESIGDPGDGQVKTKTVTNPASLQDPGGTDITQQTFEYTYDGLGRRIQEKADGKGSPPDLVTCYQYDGLGRCTQVTNPKGIVTQYGFNAFGDQTSVIEDASSLARTTTFGYDQLGRLAWQKASDGDGHTNETTNYTYNLMDCRTKITFPDNGSYAYTYDLAGRMTSRTDPRNQVTTYTHNWRGQPLTKTVQLSPTASAQLKESFSYYATGWMKAAWMDTATLAAATNKSEFLCDPFGQVTSVTQTIDGAAKTITYAFSPAGDLSQITYPTDVGVSLAFSYDALGQVNQIQRQVGTGDYATLASYTYAGRSLTSRDIVTSGSTGAGGNATHIRHEVGLDIHRRQVRLANKSVVGTVSTLLDQYDYTYDANGNRQTASVTGDARLGGNTTYGYDTLDRVTAADYGTGNGTEVFAYDLLGNRRGNVPGYTDRQGRQTTYQHNEVNEYTSITTAGQTGTPAHDAAGNLTQTEHGYQLVYDYENRLVEVEDNDAAHTTLATYTYDALGHRVAEVKNGVRTRCYYDRETVLAEYDSSDQLKRYHIHGPTYVDEHVALNEQGREYYYLLTSLYSVSGLASASGAVVERYRYDTYGLPTFFAYGDFNGDGRIDLCDFLTFQAAFSGDQPCTDSARVCDYNGDGKVDIADYRAFAASRAGSLAPISPFRFTGQRLDFQLRDAVGLPTLVLYDYRVRPYDAYHARFAGRDPAEDVDSTNLYEYVRSQPLTASDPTGRFAAYAYAEAEDAGVSLGALAYARMVAGAAMARNLLVSVAIATANGLDRVSASAAWQEIARFSSNLADKAQAVKDGFRDALNRNNSGTTGGPNDPWERHHQLPKEFKDKFENAGLDIQDYVMDIPRSLHRLNPNGLHTGSGDANWNQVWKKFFDTYKNPNKQQILDKLAEMRRDFGLE